MPDLGPFCFGEKSPDDTNHLTNHTAWGPIRRVGLLVNTAYPMQSVKTRMRCLSSVAFLKSPNNFKILRYNIVVNNGANRIIIIYITKLMPYFHNL